MTESHDIERYHLDICCRLLFRFFDNYEPIDFGNDCQASPRAVQLPERIDELDRSLLAVVTAVLIAKMDNANLVAYLCILSLFFIFKSCFFRFPTLSKQCEDPVVDVVIRIR